MATTTVQYTEKIEREILRRVETLDDIITPPGWKIGHLESSQDFSRLVMTKYVPQQLLTRYIRASMKKAVPEPLEDETWYVDIPEFNGVWANGDSPQGCLTTLEEVLLDWLLIKIEHEDRDIPRVDEIDLNVL